MRGPNSHALVLTAMCCVTTVHARPEPSAPHVASKAVGLPVSFSVGPGQSSDIAPGPPPELLALPWTLPQPPSLRPLRPMPAPPLQLRLDLPAVLGLTPFVQTTFHASSRVLPSTQLGIKSTTGPIHAGTHFSVRQDDRGLWLHNASHVRLVAPLYDLGLESLNDYALAAAPVVVRNGLLGSAGMRITPTAPTVRVSTSLFADTGSFLSALSAFGTF